MFVEIIQFTFFPGAFFILWAGLTLVWLVRKLTAKLENRMGLPFNQPIYDNLKLLAKERVYPEGSNIWLMQLLPRIQLGIAIIMGFFIPIYSTRGLLSFEGDVFFFLFLLSLHGSMAFFIGWSSRSPYSVSGAGRAAYTEISLEIPLALIISSSAIWSNSITIKDLNLSLGSIIFDNDLNFAEKSIFSLNFILLFILMIFSILGALELTPFSAAHAETEIVAGWNTELTGADLAYSKIADAVNLFTLTALTSKIFLGGPVIIDIDSSYHMIEYSIAFLIFAIEIFIVVSILGIIKTLSSRLRIDQIIKVLWDYSLPLSFGSTIVIFALKGGVL